jgi:hypothetical protein
MMEETWIVRHFYKTAQGQIVMTFILTLFLYEIQSELSHTLAYPPLLKCRGVFSFGQCIVCPSIYEFWLPRWYLQTFHVYNQVYSWKQQYFIHFNIYIYRVLCYTNYDCSVLTCLIVNEWIMSCVKLLFQEEFEDTKLGNQKLYY